MELMSKARQLEASGQSIIHLEIGEPDFPTADPIIAAAQAFLSRGHVHYTSSLGLPELRSALSEHYARRYGLHVTPNRIVVTAGASGALLLALGTLVSAGDKWLVPDPGYPCNKNFVRMFDGRPVQVPVGPASDFQPTRTDILEHWTSDTKGLMVASPSNPTGTLLSHGQLTELWNTVRGKHGHLIVDEIYHGLTYGVEPTSAVSISPDIFVINSFSKYFGMTGWRLGWMVVPEAYLSDIEKLAQNLFICPSTVAQHAALAAFKSETIEILEARRKSFSSRREILRDGLRSIGFKIEVEPKGAFYLYADCQEFGLESSALAERLLTDAGVAATPGRDFGEYRSGDHIRFAYTTEAENLEIGLDRIDRFLSRKR
jgi:aspartate/methionine/tyrosine aminotransferase